MEVLNPIAPIFRPCNPSNSTPAPPPAPAPTQTHMLTPQPHLSHRHNFPVGDVLHVKSEHAVRIYIQDVDGIKLDKDKVLFKHMLRHMRNIHADYFWFAETKRETHHHHLSQQLHHSLGRSFDHHRSAFATSPIKFDTHSKPRGASCTVVNDLVGRVTDISKDNPQDAKSAHAARYIQKAEEIKQLFRKLHGIYKSFQRNGLDIVSLFPTTTFFHPSCPAPPTSQTKLYDCYSLAVKSTLAKPTAHPLLSNPFHS
jgi:hypothetical protein